MSASLLSRRDWLKLSAAGVLGPSVSGWFQRLAAAAAPMPARKKSCILLWMSGGPSQIDTFDLKPGHKNGGSFKEIDTATPGVKISEHLPKIAKFMDKMAIIRTLTSKEGDHGRATHLLHTGYLPGTAGLNYPTLGSWVAKSNTPDELALPAFVSIAPYRFFSPAAYDSGFLGPQYAPLLIADNAAFGVVAAGGREYDYADALKVKDLEPAGKVSESEINSRIDILGELEKDFSSSRPDTPPRSHRAAYQRAVSLMKTAGRKAFDLHEEKDSVREAYGKNLFGQSCLLARRLVEKGVPFVEVTLGSIMGGGFGWDTHANNFDLVKQLSGTLDPAWAALMSDLKDRGLLDSTMIIWMGEFGRTPVINPSNGRDHWPNVSAAVLAGGGIKGGQAYGKTSKDGTAIEEKPTSVADLMATIVKGLGIDPDKSHIANGRPIKIVDKGGAPIKEIVG